MQMNAIEFYSKRIGEQNLNKYGFSFNSDGRLNIDSLKLKKYKIKNTFPDEIFCFDEINKGIFIPKYKNRKNYRVNILLDCLDSLEGDWNLEYKSNMLEKKDSSNNSKDLKEISLSSFQSIYVNFYKALNIVLKTDPIYISNNDLSFSTFLKYAQEKNKSIDEKNPIFKLKNFEYLYILDKLYNFLKNSNKETYEDLLHSSFLINEKTKDFRSSFVINDTKYENGMPAKNFLNINENSIDLLIKNLKSFSIELCKLLFAEDVIEARWNSDEALLFHLMHEID